jgi:hypothetical protein
VIGSWSMYKGWSLQLHHRTSSHHHTLSAYNMLPTPQKRFWHLRIRVFFFRMFLLITTSSLAFTFYLWDTSIHVKLHHLFLFSALPFYTICACWLLIMKICSQSPPPLFLSSMKFLFWFEMMIPISMWEPQQDMIIK